MRRLLRVRLLFVLVALLLVPALVMPFAEQLRTEWARYREPKGEPKEAENDEPDRARLAELALQAILADPSNRESRVVIRSIWTDLDVASEDERREARNRQLAMEVADAGTSCPFPQSAEEGVER